MKTFEQHLYLHMRMVISTVHSTTSLSYHTPKQILCNYCTGWCVHNHLSNHLAMYSNNISQIVTHVVIFWDHLAIKLYCHWLFSELSTSFLQALSMVHTFCNHNSNIMPIHSNSSHTCQVGSLLEVCACICKTEGKADLRNYYN